VKALATTAVVMIGMRDAAREDCEQVWAWNFAPDVRARSRRSETVAFAEHARWFERRIADGREPIWIIEAQGAPVGVVRLDVVGSGQWRISIALDAEWRGRGIGRCAVAAVCRACACPIVAEIFADNLASRACFEACGFRSIVECDGLLTYHWDPEN
jgi:RimJ/RimL family protein N-acetyltransferase